MANKVIKSVNKLKPIARDVYGNIDIWKYIREKDGMYILWTFNTQLGVDSNIHKSKIYYNMNGKPYFVASSSYTRTRKPKLDDFIIYDKTFAKLFDEPYFQREVI